MIFTLRETQIDFFTVRHVSKYLMSKCPMYTKYLSVFSPNAGKYGPEKTPYLDTFHTVFACMNKKSALVSYDRVNCYFNPSLIDKELIVYTLLNEYF